MNEPFIISHFVKRKSGKMKMMLVAILVIRAISCDLIWWRRNRELIWQIGDSLATSFSIVIDPDRYESRDDDEVNCCQKRQ